MIIDFTHKRRTRAGPRIPPAMATGITDAPKTPNPRAPNDCKPANRLPWATIPIPACTPAATEPAATPLVVNPTAEIMPAEIVFKATGMDAPIIEDKITICEKRIINVLKLAIDL